MSHTKTPRRSRALALAAVAVLTFAACGDDDDDASGGESSPATEEASAPATEPSSAPEETADEPATTEPTTTEPSATEPAGTEPAEGETSGEATMAAFTDDDYIRLLGTSEVPDYVRASVDRGAAELTDDQKALALEIWENGGGETGTGGELSIAYADGFGGNSWRRIAWMELVLQALTYPEVGEITYTTANGDPQKAISDIQSLIANDVDLIVIYADAGETLQPVVEEAQAAGIVVTSYIAPPGSASDTYVSYDICKVGTGMSGTTIEALGGEGNVVLLGGTPGNPYTATWEQCARDDYATAPGINIVGRADTNWTPEGAFEAASSFLAQEDQIDAWNYDYAAAAMQIFRAYESAGRSPDFSISTGGDEQGLFCLVEELKPEHPDLRAFHGVGGPWLTRIALSAAIDTVNGASPGATIDVPFEYSEFTGGCDPTLPEDTPLSVVVPIDVLKQMLS
jgi:ABC-type sugar transport system substrate-binding protein